MQKNFTWHLPRNFPRNDNYHCPNPVYPAFRIWLTIFSFFPKRAKFSLQILEHALFFRLILQSLFPSVLFSPALYLSLPSLLNLHNLHEHLHSVLFSHLSPHLSLFRSTSNLLFKLLFFALLFTVCIPTLRVSLFCAHPFTCDQPIKNKTVFSTSQTLHMSV